jgi:hypothetical protein
VERNLSFRLKNNETWGKKQERSGCLGEKTGIFLPFKVRNGHLGEKRAINLPFYAGAWGVVGLLKILCKFAI